MNKKDLVVLAADSNIEQALIGLFTRPEALGIRPIDVNISVHPQHDPGCATRGVEFLSNFSQQYLHGLLIFDREGSGMEQKQPQEMQKELNREFKDSAWGKRARAIVLDPELEAWVWSNSPHVDDVAGWQNRRPSLRRWLISQGHLQEEATKPERPKEALEAALRTVRKPRSASLYRQLAEKVSLRRCNDPSFLELKTVLTAWFPAGNPVIDEGIEETR